MSGPRHRQGGRSLSQEVDAALSAVRSTLLRVAGSRAARAAPTARHAAQPAFMPGRWRWLALALIPVVWTAVELWVGWQTDSASLIGDGLFTAQHAVALLVVIVGASIIRRRDGEDRRTRVDARTTAVIGSLLGLTGLAVIAGACVTLLDSDTPAATPMLMLGVLGVVVDRVTVGRPRRGMSASDRALRAHAQINLWSSIVTLVAGVGVWVTGSAVADALGALAIALLMLWRARASVTQALDVPRQPFAQPQPATRLSGGLAARIVALGVIGGIVYNEIVYGPLVISESLSKFVGVTASTVVFFVTLGTPFASAVVLPLTQRYPWLNQASMLIVGGCALAASLLPVGWWILVPFVLASMFFIAPFANATAATRLVKAGKEGRKADALFWTALLTAVTVLSWAFAAAAGAMRVLFGVVAVVLVVSALVNPALAPTPPPDRTTPIRTLIKKPWTQWGNGEVRLTAIMQALSAFALAMLDGAIPLVMVNSFGKVLGEQLSAYTNIAVLVGGFAGPALSRLPSLRSRLIVSGTITSISFVLFALYSASWSEWLALLVMIAARSLLEIGTTGTTASSPGVRRGDNAVMSLMQVMRNCALLGAGAGAWLYVLGKELGAANPWLFVVTPAGALMVGYMWLSRRLPRGTPIVEQTEAGALKFHSPVGDETLIITTNDPVLEGMQMLEMSPGSRVFVPTAFHVDPPGVGGDRKALVLGSDLLADLSKLSEGGKADVAWDDPRQRYIVVVRPPDGSDMKPEDIVFDILWKYRVQEVYVVTGHLVAPLSGRRRAARWLRRAQRRPRARVFGRAKALTRPGRGGGVARSWTRTGKSMGVGNMVHDDVIWAANGARITNVSWHMDELDDDGWRHVVEGDLPGKRPDHAARRCTAELVYLLGLTGASAVTVADRTAPGVTSNRR